MEVRSIRAVASVWLPPYVEFVWCGATGPVAQYACSESLVHSAPRPSDRVVVTVDCGIALCSPLREKARTKHKYIALVRDGPMEAIHNEGRQGGCRDLRYHITAHF